MFPEPEKKEDETSATARMPLSKRADSKKWVPLVGTPKALRMTGNQCKYKKTMVGLSGRF